MGVIRGLVASYDTNATNWAGQHNFYDKLDFKNISQRDIVGQKKPPFYIIHIGIGTLRDIGMSSSGLLKVMITNNIILTFN